MTICWPETCATFRLSHWTIIHTIFEISISDKTISNVWCKLKCDLQNKNDFRLSRDVSGIQTKTAILKLLPNTMTQNTEDAIYVHEFIIPESALDQNGHVNNVVYVQWMQDVAILHSESTGGTQATHSIGATWFVRSHNIEYLTPAFAGDQVVLQTWVADFRRARSLRRYRFLRKNDQKLLAKGETEWVFVDMKSGRPRTIPSEVQITYPLIGKEDEP